MKATEAAFRALEQKAITYAIDRHKGQTYGGDKPYQFHLKQVRDVAMEMCPYLSLNVAIEVVAIAAWLHDSIEDTGASREDLEHEFGKEVADLVWAVTNEPGANRKIRALSTYPKIAKSQAAVFLKLADRIANVRAGGKTDMYRAEQADFRQALYKKGTLDPVWAHLESLLAPEPTK